MLNVTRTKSIQQGATRVILLLLALLHTTSIADANTLVAEYEQPYLEIVAPARVETGEPIEIELVVHRAQNIAGYETHLLFDTSVAHLSGVRQRNNTLATLGHEVAPLEVAELPNGAAIGLYTCGTGDCRKSVASAPGRPEGNPGVYHLATVLIGPRVPGQLELSLDATRFVDAAGKVVDVALPRRAFTVTVGDGSTVYPSPGTAWQLPPAVPPPTEVPDLTGDGRIDQSDATEVAIEWILRREANSPCGDLPLPDRDVNGDGCIDVADIQAVSTYAPSEEPLPGVPTAPSAVYLPLVHQNRPSPVTTSSRSDIGIFVVTTTADRADSNPGDGLCLTSSGCTLRSAIEEANAHTGPDRIEFNIPGSGVQTIQLTTRLPALSDLTGATTIDGYTQPGAVPNSDPLVSDAKLMIELRGNGSAQFDAFYISSGGNTVRGLALYNLKRAIWLYGLWTDNNVIAGNFIGTNAAGTFAASTYAYPASGLVIQNGPSNNWVGTPDIADRNVISGNARHGVEFHGEDTDRNYVYNNLIGLAPSGTNRLQNLKHGIDINRGSSYNLIGGLGERQRNIISGNGQPSLDDYTAGIEISHDRTTERNEIVGNCLGTDVTCSIAPNWAYNSHYGIRLEDGVSYNIVAGNTIGNSHHGGIQLDTLYTSGNRIHSNYIGVTRDGQPIPNSVFGLRIKYHASGNVVGPNNTIAYNPVGVQIEFDSEDFNTITQNSIYSNRQLGIDLGPYHGVSANDDGDLDEGANRGLNVPTLISASPTQIRGTACSAAIVTGPCIIEVFIADRNPDDLGSGSYGQGRTYLGSTSTNPDGSFSIAVSGVNEGEYVTATATDAEGNTSEFAHNIVVRIPVGSTPTRTPTETPTGTPTWTPTETPTGTPTWTPTETPTGTPTETPTVTPTETPTGTPTEAPTGTPTSTPTAPASPTSTRTPTPVASACGGLVQEAEIGTLAGKFVVGNDAVASGGKYVHGPNGSGTAGSLSGNSHHASYCFEVTTAGTYRIKGWVYAAGADDDSFFVTVDGMPTSGYLWDIPINQTYQPNYVSNRGSTGPVQLTLATGQHTIRVYLREDGARLDKLELERIQ